MGRKRRRAPGRGPTRGVRRPGLLGTVRLRDSGGEVSTAEGDFKLARSSLREVMDGDVVSVSLHRGDHGRRRAVVESVVERASSSFVGTYAQAGPLGVVHPLDGRLHADFFIPPEDPSARELGVALGDVVRARVVSYPTRYESGVATLDKRIGGTDAPGVGTWAVMARYGLEEGYPAAALGETDALELDVDAALADPLRRDARERFCVTIDPVDARDFDDAISIERTPAGGFSLGVHIADVSHYVAWGSALDLEARSRGTSVYLADRVLPMLPERLSAGLCSLVAGADRLAVTVDIELDAQGRVLASRAYPSVIRSAARLSYDQADALLDVAGADALADEAPDGEGVPAGGAPLADIVRACHSRGRDLQALLAAADELAGLRRSIRAARGAVDFETSEMHATVDESGEPVAIAPRVRTRATSLVEEAMLLANECVAGYLETRGAACAWRVHEPPAPERLAEAARALAALGAIDAARARAIALGDRDAMRASIRECAHAPAGEVVAALLLRSMMRAVYRPANEGHYALAAPAYLHFTSPIRRYPDLVAHRALKLELARERLGARQARGREPFLVGTGHDALSEVLPALCRHASERERVADAAARASQRCMAVRFFSSRIGERSWGTVAWMDAAGAFVRLDGTGAEGRVAWAGRDGAERYALDERTWTATGCSTGRRLALGDRVEVVVAATDAVRGRIDLTFARAGRALHS